MKLFYVTNIPTPYRQFRFELLSKELESVGVELVVHYMGKSEPGRFWDVDTASSPFKVVHWRSLKLTRGNDVYYLWSFEMFKLIYRYSQHDGLMVIGGYYSPALWLLLLIGSKNRKILSLESNLNSEKNSGLIARSFKRFLLSCAQRFQVTGESQKEYVRDISAKPRDFIVLPNIVNELPFTPQNRNDKVVFISARLIPIKGLVEFCEALKGKGYSIRIAGSGQLYNELSAFDFVTCLGQLNESQMQHEYLTCGIFALPSLEDPSPLSAIESLRYGCYTILSSRVGNTKDIFSEDSNYVFNVKSVKSINKVIDHYEELSMDQRNFIRHTNQGIYNNRFESGLVISNYVSNLFST